MSIVGYTYKANNYCPECTLRRFAHDRHACICRVCMRGMTTEDYMNVVAEVEGIDRDNENTFDTGDFPKPLLRIVIDSLDKHVYCGECHRRLGR